MESDSHLKSSPEPKYKKTNILVVVFIVFSIIPALQSLGYVLVCVLVDVFAVIGIISARTSDDNSSYPINPHLFLLLGIALILSSIGYLVIEGAIAHLESLSIAIYFLLVGISFFLNKWERDRATD